MFYVFFFHKSSLSLMKNQIFHGIFPPLHDHVTCSKNRVWKICLFFPTQTFCPTCIIYTSKCSCRCPLSSSVILELGFMVLSQMLSKYRLLPVPLLYATIICTKIQAKILNWSVLTLYLPTNMQSLNKTYITVKD